MIRNAANLGKLDNYRGGGLAHCLILCSEVYWNQLLEYPYCRNRGCSLGLSGSHTQKEGNQKVEKYTFPGILSIIDLYFCVPVLLLLH